MSAFSSPRFLPRVLLVDSATGFSTGILQLAFTDALAQWFNLPAALLLGTGWFLLGYGAAATWVATREPVPRSLVWLFVVGNLAWALACIALLLGHLVQPGPWGVAYVLLHVVTVTLMAELQWFGLRQTSSARLSTA